MAPLWDPAREGRDEPGCKGPFAGRMGDQAPSGHQDPPRSRHRGSAPATDPLFVLGIAGHVAQGWWATDGATRQASGRGRARDLIV